ncbi:MAG: FMN-binding protein [Chloroflexota bacterium]
MIFTIGLIIAAWLIGYFTSGADVAPLVPEVLPGATSIQTQGPLFLGYDVNGELVGYAAVGQASGYGGPIEMLVGVNADGDILGSTIVVERESPGFFRLVENSGLIESYAGQVITDPLQLGEDLDAVSGATVSAEGVALAVRTAVQQIAADGLNTPLPPQKQPIEFGIPEIVLILLFATSYVAHKMRSRVWKNRVRWGTLLTGMIVLGFIYTAPFTITMVVSLLSGFWPDWHTNLYWYILMGGIIFATTVDSQNPYCYWFCPFGAVQQCVAVVTGAKLYRPRDYNVPLKWLQRGLALTAILLGLALRRPGVASYEPFATLFDFRGTGVEWVFLILIMLVSLMIYRPFCNYLCPLDVVVEFIAVWRRWVKEIWATWRKEPTKT